MQDERRKGRERKVVSVDGRLLRPCSRSFPLNSSTSSSGERSAHGGRGCRRMESQDDARESAVGKGEREIRVTRRGVQERELRSITQDGTTAGMLRERNKEEERKGGRKREKERTEAAAPVG